MKKESIFQVFNNRPLYEKHLKCLESHLKKYFKEDEINLLTDPFPSDLRIDIYLIKPKNKEYNILVTSGMSYKEMFVNEEIENRNDYLFAELMVLIPKNIGNNLAEENSWILNMLWKTATFPHYFYTFLSIGHTLQATEDLQPYETNTKFIGCVILPSVTFDIDFTEFICDNNKINIYSVFPLYKNELEFKVKNSYEEFEDLLSQSDLNEVLDIRRKNLIPSEVN